MQRTTFVAQPPHFSMSAMRRILSAAATPTDTIPRYDTLQPNSALFPPSSLSFSSSSSSTTPQFSSRRRRGSIAQATSHQVMPVAVSSSLTVPSLSASAPSSSNGMYDTHAEDSDDDFDDDLDDHVHLSDEQAMWTTHSATERSTPIAIPNAGNASVSRARYASSPVLPDPGSIVTSYLIRHAAREGESSDRGVLARSARASISRSMQRSPFAPEVPFGEVIPGKPETGGSMSKKMAYFDEDALY